MQKENKGQLSAIRHASGPIQVLAGPGSGKTYLTVRRIRHLICHHGISPEKILVITFTKAAALEMEERFQRLTDNKYPVRFGTFHAVYFQILRRSNPGRTNSTLISHKEKRKYLEHILKQRNRDDSREEIDQLIKNISYIKNGGSVNAVSFEDISFIYQEYCAILKEESKVDFDDMILLCDKMLTERADILQYWQQTFTHILVDEFQDISMPQYEILKKIAAPENHLFVVGDDDQAVYGFRGTGPHIMKRFMTDYPDAKQVILDKNYRSQLHIVKAASLLISENKNRFVKETTAVRDAEGKVKICGFQTKEEEERYLMETLKTISREEMGKTAVICRTNAQALHIARLAAKENLPFTLKSKAGNIFQQDIALDMIAFLRFAHDIRYHGQGKRRDFLRIMNKPCRYIKREALQRDLISKEGLLEYYRTEAVMGKEIRFFFGELNKLAKLCPYLAIDYIRRSMDYDKWLKENGRTEQRKSRLETADEIEQTAKGCKNLEEWLVFIDSYTEKIEAYGSADKKESNKEGIQLVTMHGSKGLEYENVFLPDICKGLMPSKKAMTQEEIEEERRLLYVAMTRARASLELLYYKEPSVFLENMVKAPYIIRKESVSSFV